MTQIYSVKSGPQLVERMTVKLAIQSIGLHTYFNLLRRQKIIKFLLAIQRKRLCIKTFLCSNAIINLIALYKLQSTQLRVNMSIWLEVYIHCSTWRNDPNAFGETSIMPLCKHIPAWNWGRHLFDQWAAFWLCSNLWPFSCETTTITSLLSMQRIPLCKKHSSSPVLMLS